MTEQPKNNRSLEKTMVKILSSFAVVLTIFIIFGYSVGADMALRDNAREAALTHQ